MFNKTKFPGKPSKLVNKKRVSVLSADNNFDKRTNDHCEIYSEKNLASPKHEHGYQEVIERALILHFCNFYHNLMHFNSLNANNTILAIVLNILVHYFKRKLLILRKKLNL